MRTANEHDRRPASMTPPRSTPLATPVDLRRQRNTSDRELASRFHPGYRDAIGRLPAGGQVFRGLPFRFARATTERRWLLLDREVVVDLRATGPASHVVVAHFCDAWRDPVAGRPARPADRLGHAGRPAAGPLHRGAGVGAVRRRGHAPAVRGERGHHRLGPGRLRRRRAHDRHAARLARPVSGDAGGWLRRAGPRGPARDPAG